MTPKDQTNHYNMATCPKCGKEYQKYDSKQNKCPECKAKLMAFLITKDLRDKLDTLPKGKKSQFVREALEEAFKWRDAK